ncbi:unnamed protein product [Didymodactylos carnosus]|uniref:Uncharacterized protein n=1 Tax=Didymodactylos carnosus TaxID=1234261 RepID=A0A813XRU6_9BILA|nr:unnamed protein product [Didymodactylos carnosus]CAF0991303.1 unnamed protein product [Didymodactylos carnosus]CAF3660946.1 unnamed protein product [Didymodactylos carnosus]CAF3761364.1 unnamed protein product [Didymodactylos carnosus]
MSQQQSCITQISRNYCSCATCTQIRNEQPRIYRYLNYLRTIITCSCCCPPNIDTHVYLNSDSQRSIRFRDSDVDHKHCSRHEVMVKPMKIKFSKSKLQEIKLRVKEANSRWKRMSLIPPNIIELIIQNIAFLPLCNKCRTHITTTSINLCETCIKNITDYRYELELMKNSSTSTMSEEIEHSPLTSLSTSVIASESRIPFKKRNDITIQIAPSKPVQIQELLQIIDWIENPVVIDSSSLIQLKPLEQQLT